MYAKITHTENLVQLQIVCVQNDDPLHDNWLRANKNDYVYF